MRNLACACLLASGCYTAPTVAAPVTQTVGCVSSQRSGKHRTYWIGDRIVPHDEVEHALEAVPASYEEAKRYHRESAAALAMFFAGAGLAAASFAAMGVWISNQPESQAPFAMLGVALGGYAVSFSGFGIGVHSDAHWRRAIDAYNAEAAASGRCPPDPAERRNAPGDNR